MMLHIYKRKQHANHATKSYKKRQYYGKKHFEDGRKTAYNEGGERCHFS